MATLADLVPSLDLCQQLKQAGFPQDTALVWSHITDGDDVWERSTAVYHDCPYVAAPTAEEMNTAMPWACLEVKAEAAARAWLREVSK